MHLPYIPKRLYKTPLAVLGYEFDWTRWLTRRGDTIASYTFTVPDGLTLSAMSEVDGIVYVTIAGGVDDTKYRVTCTVTTTGLGIAGVLVNTRSMILCIADM